MLGLENELFGLYYSKCEMAKLSQIVVVSPTYSGSASWSIAIHIVKPKLQMKL